MSRLFYCDGCQRSFVTDVSREEALAETEEVFGYIPPPEEQASVCDDCWKEIMRVFKERRN